MAVIQPTVTPTSAAQTQAAQTAALNGAGNAVTASANEAASAFGADFDTFLKMLTTQLQYQDPLQPIDSTEFVAQLAQFSTVEQQIATNTALGKILDAMGASGAGALGAWLGKEIRGATSISWQAGEVDVYPVDVPPAASETELTIRAVNGTVIRTIPFAASADVVTWDGMTDAGVPAPAGTYSFETRHKLGDDEPKVAPAEVFGRVVEARRETDDSVTLVIEGGMLVPASNVTALRG